MAKVFTYLGQGAIYVAIAGLLGYFSTSPAYEYFPADRAQLMLSFSHNGKPKGPCRKLSPEEIAEVAANMRRPEVCPRERLPVQIELELGGEVIYRDSRDPTGLSKDGAAQVYERFVKAPGEYRLVVRMRDSDRPSGFDYETAATVMLEAGQNLVIDFRSEVGAFVFGAGSNPHGANQP